VLLVLVGGWLRVCLWGKRTGGLHWHHWILHTGEHAQCCGTWWLNGLCCLCELVIGGQASESLGFVMVMCFASTLAKCHHWPIRLKTHVVLLEAQMRLVWTALSLHCYNRCVGPCMVARHNALGAGINFSSQSSCLSCSAACLLNTAVQCDLANVKLQSSRSHIAMCLPVLLGTHLVLAQCVVGKTVLRLPHRVMPACMAMP
jgi:hypothetical protein